MSPPDEQTPKKASGWRRGLPYVGRAGKWLAVLLIVSVMVPALTTQWSDRQKELDLKTALVSQMTGSAATATQDAFTLVADEAKSSTNKNEVWRAQYREILKEWRVAAFTLESELDAYFPRVRVDTAPPSTLVEAFDRYNVIIQEYIRLSLDECSHDKARQEVVRDVYGYLAAAVPKAIANNPAGTGSGPRCWPKSEAFRVTYQDLGGNLLDGRDILVEAVIHSNAAGYNVGFRDFVRQVLPFF